MKRTLLATIALCLAPAISHAQKLELKLDALAARASDKTEVDLDEASMALGGKFAAGSVPKQFKGMLDGIKEIHVRNFEFAKRGEYSDKDLEPVRKQLAAGSGWNRIINVKEKDESTEIYIFPRNGEAAGFVVLVAEAKELTLVHLAGSMALEKLTEMVKSHVQFDLKSIPALNTGAH